MYARAPYLEEDIVPEVQDAIKQAGLRFSWRDFKVTDNSCPPEPEPRVVAPKDIDTAVDDVKALEDRLVTFGAGFTMFRDALTDEEKRLEKEFKDDLKKAEDAVAKVERRYAPANSSSLWSFLVTYLPGF